MFLRLLAGLLLVLVSNANAANGSTGDAGTWHYLKYQKQYALLERMRTIFPTNPAGTEWVIPSPPTITNTPGGGVDIKNTATVPVAGTNVPVNTTKNVSNRALANVAGGVLKNAARLGGPLVGAYATATAVRDVLQAAEIYFAPDLFTADKPLYKRDISFCSSEPPNEADIAAKPYQNDPRFTVTWNSKLLSGGACQVGWLATCTAYSWCPAFSPRRNVATDPYAAPKVPLTPQEITDLIAQKQLQADFLQDLINQDKEHERRNGINPFGYVEPSLVTSQPITSGPSSSPGRTSSSTKDTTVSPGTTTPNAPGSPGDPATATTTTTTTNNYTYNNNVVNNTTTTVTTTTITNNVTNVTGPATSETETSEPVKEDPPVDSPLGDIPALYERKYPDGMVGIWNQKSQLIKQSSMFTLAAQLMPTELIAGACPAWQIDLTFASWAPYGVRNVAPPCWIWDLAKTIILISALLLARALVFGG